MTLTDKVVLITGAARGQGAAEAELLSGLGARVVACDVLTDDGEALAELLGPSVTYRRLDVTDAVAWASTVSSCSSTRRTVGSRVAVTPSPRRRPRIPHRCSNWNRRLPGTPPCSRFP